MGIWTDLPPAFDHAPDLRHDEEAARVLLVEASHVCAGLLCRALERAARGHFAIDCQEGLEDAERSLAEHAYDVVLIDLALPGGGAVDIDAASGIAHRVPVVLLTGTQNGALASSAEASDEPDPLGRIDRADLPATILRAIRRHRRLGAGGVDPVICRIPHA